jgi:hypothetical protein
MHEEKTVLLSKPMVPMLKKAEIAELKISTAKRVMQSCGVTVSKVTDNGCTSYNNQLFLMSD